MGIENSWLSETGSAIKGNGSDDTGLPVALCQGSYIGN